MTIRHFLSIVEIQTKIVSVGTYITAMAYLYWSKIPINPGAAVLMFAAVVCVDMGTTAFNSFFDYTKGVDTRDLNREKEKVLVHDGVDPGAAFWTGFILFALSIVMGFILALWRGWLLIPAGAVSLAAGFFYTGGPRPVSFTPFGEIVAGGFLGSLLFCLVCYVQTGEFTLPCFAASLPLFFTIAQILTVNNTCDIKGDREAGRRTLSILIGYKFSCLLIALESLSAAAAVFIAAQKGYLPAMQRSGMIFVLVFSLIRLLFLYKKGLSHESKGTSMGVVSSMFSFFVLVYSLVFVFSA